MPPRQLDFCAQCRAPIYMEAVPGACSCDLGKLRAIQAHLRIQQEERLQQIRSGVTNVAPPDLAAAVQAAADARQARTNAHAQRQASATPRPSLESILMDEARRATGQLGAELPAQYANDDHLEDFFQPVIGVGETPEASRADYRQRMASQRVASQRAAAPVARPRLPSEPVSLTSLWGGSELQEMADAAGVELEQNWVDNMEAEYQPGGALDTDTGDIQFDSEINFDTPSGPRMQSSREAVRFRADRGAPERRPFNATMEPGPADGEVVANIRDRNYEQVRPGARGLRMAGGMSIAEVRARAREQAYSEVAGREGPILTRPATAAEVARVRQDGGRSVQRAITESDTRQRPTVYDRLTRHSFLDDD